ncbi:MAG: calcium-binding protein [Tateyamaria sp.]|uniref:calcium-binding protein n=1 Tax=Tateyamaria sp. TaxID=1929288 RepID=UPI00328C2F62
MFGFAILGLLGIGLIVNLVDDDDSESAEGSQNDEDMGTVDMGGDETDTDGMSAVGTSDADLIEPGNGDDTVFAGAGDDVVIGGDGDDSIFAGEDNDLILGGDGDDFLRGQSGADFILGDAGEDEINGDVGNDTISGADIIDGEGLFNASLEATLQGRTLTDAEINSFNDLTADPMEADTLNGGFGDDAIIAGSNDVVDTGLGEDVVNVGEWVDPDAPVEITGFTPAEDTIIYSYTGPIEPNVNFGEDENGLATLDVDGETVATFPGNDFFDLTAESAILLERLS